MPKYKVTHQLGEDIVQHQWGPAIKDGNLTFLISGEIVTAYEKHFWMKVERVND